MAISTDIKKKELIGALQKSLGIVTNGTGIWQGGVKSADLSNHNKLN